MQLASARILAIDMSAASLAFAQRMTRKLGVGNLEYAKADIMRLASVGSTFDVIEAVGVLHHLRQPLAGLSVLSSLLRPRGLMRLGLYSESARASVVAARRLIAERGYRPNVEDIRLARQEFIAARDDPAFAPLTGFADFYSTSACRDLLFNAEEHRFTLPQIKAALAGLGLRLVGFSISPDILRKYRARFPDDTSETNLDYWDAFEQDHPDSFAGMYQFWAQKQF